MFLTIIIISATSMTLGRIFNKKEIVDRSITMFVIFSMLFVVTAIIYFGSLFTIEAQIENEFFPITYDVEGYKEKLELFAWLGWFGGN